MWDNLIGSALGFFYLAQKPVGLSSACGMRYNKSMILIVDGHNLIPKIPGLSLGDENDEAELIRLLQEYARLRRKSIEVYFDNAPAEQAGMRKFGRVQAHFVRRGTTADDAIKKRLRILGKRAKNVQVISSDRQVQQAARAVHASVITSVDFAADWGRLMEEDPELNPRDRLLSEKEVAAWEQFFRQGHPPQDDS